MTINETITFIRKELISAFAVLDAWFDKDDNLHQFKHNQEAFAVREILEHIMLTSHYLMLLIDKGGKKALKKAQAENLHDVLLNYTCKLDILQGIDTHNGFAWAAPGHMQPSGTRPLHEVRTELRDQLDRCLCHLALLCNGEGVLHKTTMTINGIGKIDVYQYIYFLVLHIKRHLAQLEKIEVDYVKQFA